jgi:hypothetical protein
VDYLGGGKYEGNAAFQMMAASMRAIYNIILAHQTFLSQDLTRKFRRALIPTRRPAIAPAK